jgi:hypothetical protein
MMRQCTVYDHMLDTTQSLLFSHLSNTAFQVDQFIYDRPRKETTKIPLFSFSRPRRLR